MTEAPRQTQRGFTLVELMVSLVIFSFAIAGIMAVAVTMTRAYREQRRAIATENAARAPMDFIADAVRSASPGVTTGNIQDANTCATGAVTLMDTTTASDELEIVYASGGIVSTTHSAFTSTSTAITLPTEHIAQFAAGDYVLVTDSTQGTVVKVTSVTGNNLDIAPTCSTAFPGGGYPAGSILVRAQRARFSIGTLDGLPTLFMDPDGTAGPAVAEPVAEGVEDLQVALGIDADGSGDLLDDGTTGDEWTGNANGDVQPAGSIRAVKVVLVARDTKELTGGTATFKRPAALNRSAATGFDKFRRRVLTSTIEIRNLAGSPE